MSDGLCLLGGERKGCGGHAARIWRG
jgi:hypothetical protein